MSLVLTKSMRNPSKEQLQLPQQPETVLTISAQAGKKIHVILAESGRLYRFVDAKTGEIVRPLQLERQKRKLVIQLEGEQTVEILDFFDEVPGRAKSEYVIEGSSSESSSLSVSSDWALGTATSLEVTQVLWTPMGVNSLLLGTSISAGLSFTGAVAASVVQISTTASTNAAEPTGTIVKGQFMAGPVVKGHDLVASLYDLDGKLLGSAAIDANGRFSINIGNYMGPILAKVTDVPNAQQPDFFDEGTQGLKDLNAFLMAVEVVSRLNTVITLNVNEATTAAARLAGFNPVNGTGSFERSTAAVSYTHLTLPTKRIV